MIDAWAAAAVRLKKGGYDGCDIPFYGGHLLENFLSPLANRRTDEYGGSLENRLRLAREVLRGRPGRRGPRLHHRRPPQRRPLRARRAHPGGPARGRAPDRRPGDRRLLDGERLEHGDAASTRRWSPPRSTIPTGSTTSWPRSRGPWSGSRSSWRAGCRRPSRPRRRSPPGVCDLVGMTRAIIADPELPRKTPGGPARRHPRLRRRQRGVHRSPPPGQGDRLRPEPGDRARGRAGRDPPGRAAEARRRGRRRGGRAGGRAGGRDPRTPGDAARGHAGRWAARSSPPPGRRSARTTR